MHKSTFKARFLLLLPLFAAFSLISLNSCVRAQNANGDYLLTENGITNPQHSNYKNTSILKTGGAYYATPAFDKAITQLGENGTVTNPTPFSKGILTNGDITTNDYKRRPMPYAYWHNTQKGTLIFNLNRNYSISKVRVHVLQKPKIHGISRIGIYTWEDMLEAGSQPMQELVPKNGWNEFAINKTSDVIKLDFTSQKDCPYMTISEVEIWGRETADQTKIPMPQKTLTPRDYQAFDFGPAGSPVFDNFTPVSSTTVYDKKKGYGWIPFRQFSAVASEQTNFGAGSAAVPGLLERDRGKEVKIHSTLLGDFCGAQRAYHPQLAQQFAVDLKPGKYHVYLTTGDISYGKVGRTGMTIEAEGKRIINGVRFEDDVTAKLQFDVTVTDGQLNLILSNDEAGPDASWNISGLCIFPANNDIEKATAHKEIAEIEEDISAQQKVLFDSIFKKVERRETNQLFPLTKAQEAQGYLLFARDWMKMIYPNTIPLKSEVDQAALKFACAPGEYEPATLGIYPLAKGLKATVAISDLRNGKNIISQSNISVRLVGYLNERMKDETRTAGDDTYYLANTSLSNTYMTKVPKVLLPIKEKISVDETKQLWLTVHVPEDAKPGQYTGTLTFAPQNHPQQIVPITLTVYPIHLLKSDRIEGMYWNDVLIYPQNRRKQLEDMRRHGIRAVVLGKSSIYPKFKKSGDKVSGDKVIVNFTEMDALIEDLRKADMTGPIPFETAYLENYIKWFLKTNPDVKMTFDGAYQFVIAQMCQHAREKQWPEILFYPVDEIGNRPDRIAELKHLGALIRAANKDAKIYVTANGYAAGVESADFIDVQVVNIPLSKEQEQAILKSGKNYMRYGNSYNYNPRISRTVSGFGFWRIPATAMFYWHYQDTIRNPFDALDGKSRDWITAYPSPGGPLDSLDFEAIREGIDDLNYLYTMQTLMQKAKGNPAVKEGQAILDEIMNCVPSYSQYDLMGVPNDKYHEWRMRMARVIEELQCGME